MGWLANTEKFSLFEKVIFWPILCLWLLVGFLLHFWYVIVLILMTIGLAFLFL